MMRADADDARKETTIDREKIIVSTLELERSSSLHRVVQLVKGIDDVGNGKSTG